MRIVAPAGNMERFHAAVKGGAHEIYMGLKGFGARRNAENFTLSEYIEALNYAHERGVRVFLTLNTVMRDGEIEALYENVKKLYENGLDAIIVQDLGLFSFLKRNSRVAADSACQYIGVPINRASASLTRSSTYVRSSFTAQTPSLFRFSFLHAKQLIHPENFRSYR